MTAVGLTAGERANLLSLQATSELVDTTQQRLATGKRVNSALDNPVSFFTSQSLGGRASDLSALVDQIGQSVQALQATDNGLSSLVKLAQSALAIAQQAKKTPAAGTNAYNTFVPVIGTTDITPTAATTITGAVDMTNVSTTVNGMVIRVGGTAYTVSSAGSPGLNQIITDINNSAGLGAGGAATASKDASGHLVLTSNGGAPMTVDWGGGAMVTGLINPDLTQVVPSVNGTSLTVQSDNAASKTINFGSGAGEVANYGDLIQALQGTNVGSYIYGFGGPERLELNAYEPSGGIQPTVTLSGTALAVFGLAGGTQAGSLTGTQDQTRAGLAQQYNAILQQTTQIAGDASYNGSNLLKGDTLNVTLNETGLSTIAINGVMDDAAGLGLSAVPGDGFQTDADVDAHIANITAAIDTMRRQAVSFSSTLSTVKVRQDFTASMIQTLQNGSDDLVLADGNQEGAALLALQTRQQLSTTALSLATQASQAVLRLFS